MPTTPDGMTSIETTIPDSWMEKIEAIKAEKGVNSIRQVLRDLIYEGVIKDKKAE